MKKTVKLVLIILLVSALLCAVTALAACNRPELVDLRVENAKTEFKRGEAFETGESFKVYADYADGTSVDVTDKAEIRTESGMDMNVSGDYQITVAYGDKRTIYTIYVGDEADVLRKIELDTSAVKKQYKLADKVSLDGLVLKLTHATPNGSNVESSTTSLVGFDVSIVGGNGVVITDVFTALGTFTVTVSKGIVKASYDVEVDGVNVSTVSGALTVGGYYSNKIASGEAHVQGATLHPGIDPNTGEPLYQPDELFTTANYQYAFGDNYTYFKETHDSPNTEYHCSMDDEGLFVTYLVNKEIRTSNRNTSDMMYGSPFLLWYNGETVYGVENTLNNLYAHALRCSNNDLVETADESARAYSFTFSGLEYRDNSSDYYETSVSFTLGEDYSISSVTIEQHYYENNINWSSQPDYKPTFTTDPETGITTPGDEYSYRTYITVTQTSGERNIQNKYSRDMFNVSSYKLKLNGEVIEDGAVVNLDAGQRYTFNITNVLPSTANFSVDTIEFDYDGNTDRISSMLSNEHFTISASGSQISLTTRHGGRYTIYIMTTNTTRTLIIDVTGTAPQEMEAMLYNNTSGTFYEGNDRTVAIGGDVYFYGEVEAYANSAQTATITSDNGEFATIVKTTVEVRISSTTTKTVDCWKFTATQAGTYQVKVESEVSLLTNCVFTFTVSEAIDFETILNGTYTVQDRVGDVYRVTFAWTDVEQLQGTVNISKTPTDENNNLLEDQAVQRTWSFAVENMEIAIDGEMDDKLYAEFVVDDNNNLVLQDQRGYKYTLTREE